MPELHSRHDSGHAAIHLATWIGWAAFVIYAARLLRTIAKRRVTGLVDATLSTREAGTVDNLNVTFGKAFVSVESCGYRWNASESASAASD
jgi:hypothetical protein